MTSLRQRARAALYAFAQPNAVKSWGVNGINDILSGASGFVGRNQDITLSEEGAATAFGLNTGLQRSIKFKQDAIGMLKGGIYDGNTNELLISLTDRTLDMSVPGATFLAAMRTYAQRHYHDFIGSIIFSNNLYGETYTYRLVNTEGGVTGVRWLNPLYTKPNIQRGKIVDFRYSAEDGYFTLPESGMAYNIYHRNTREDLLGWPPVLSALDGVNIERNEKRAVMAYFRNGMNPGGAMSPKGDGIHLSEMEIRKMETRFQQIYGGVDNMFRWLITPTEFTYTNFDQPDLQKNWSIIKEARLEVMMSVGVPVELAGDPSGTKYENADKVMQNWLRVNGKAEATSVAAYITDGMLRYFEPNAAVYFGYDFTDIDRQDAPLTQSDFTSGIIPINIAQAQRGYEVDEGLKDIYDWGGKPIHRDVLIQISRDPSAFSAVTPTPLTLHTPGQPALPAPPTIQALPENTPSEPQKGATSLCVLLDLANHPDLMDLQKRLKTLYPDPAVKWNDPADFHITLVYAPAVDDGQIADVLDALPTLSADGLSLNVGSLMCFDNVGEHALHFRITRNSALLDLQGALYDACDINGVQMSGYSLPERYTPHVTMGYLPEKIGRITFHGKVSVQPRGLICSVERGGAYETVYPVAENDAESDTEAVIKNDTQNVSLDQARDDVKNDTKNVTAIDGNHTHDLPVMTRDYSPEKALAELKAWQNFASRGKSKRAFVFDMLKGDPADYITGRLAAGDAPNVILKALTPRFDGSRLKAFQAATEDIFTYLLGGSSDEIVKSIDSLESDFSGRFNSMLKDFRNSNPRDPGKASAILQFLNQNFIRSAYIEGMAAGGVEDDPDNEDNVAIRSLVSDANSYVSGFVDTLYGAGISDAQAALKAGQWWRGSIMPAYNAGLLSANGNLMMEFGGEDGDEICSTCQKLKGQRHRFKHWKARNLDVPHIGQATECGGWKCLHKLIPVTGRAKGSW